MELAGEHEERFSVNYELSGGFGFANVRDGGGFDVGLVNCVGCIP